MRDVTDDEFDTATAEGVVLLDFYGAWCPPCKALAPILEALEEQVTDVTFLKVNIDDQAATTKRFSVTLVPTLILLKDGVEVKRHLGILSAPKLTEWLKV